MNNVSSHFSRGLSIALAIAGLGAGITAIASKPPEEGHMPPLDGAVTWLNSAPLGNKSLRGKVVLVNFWTYSCINSLRELPYLKAWAARYKDDGLVVIGVHTPEFGFEGEPVNVRRAVAGLGLTFPVAIDSNRSIWDEFSNQYWPANYFVDGKGRIRYRHFGEGDYEQSENVIRELLHETGAVVPNDDNVHPMATGPEAPSSHDVRSPETYAGYLQAVHFASPQKFASDSLRPYSLPLSLQLNDWGLAGVWKVGPEHAELRGAEGRIRFRFHARDLHMVLGPAKDGRAIRFRITVDGEAPADDRGSDTGPDGAGEIHEPRMYQLIRQNGPVRDRTFEIEFLDLGAQVFSFTFG